MRRVLLLIMALSIPALFFPAAESPALTFGDIEKAPEPPRLMHPITDKVDLSGKAELEFSWMTGFGTVDHYEFRLFKGYNMYAKDLVVKLRVAAKESRVAVKADRFEAGQVYTWSLVRVGLNGKKSDASSQSFEVVKENRTQRKRYGEEDPDHSRQPEEARQYLVHCGRVR